MNETSGFDNIADRSKKNTFKKRFWLPYKCRHGFVTSLQFSMKPVQVFFYSFSLQSSVIFLCEQRCEYERKNTPPKINKRNQRQKKRNKLEMISFSLLFFGVFHSYDFPFYFHLVFAFECIIIAFQCIRQATLLPEQLLFFLAPFKCQCILFIGLTFIF